MRTYYPWNDVVISPLLWSQLKSDTPNGGAARHTCAPEKSQKLAAYRVAVNAKEIDTGVEIQCFCPGANEEKFDVEVQEDTLTIKGEFTPTDASEKFLLQEVKPGEFQRTLRLPFNIDRDAVDAVFAKGVLSISVKRPVVAPEKKITIRVQ